MKLQIRLIAWIHIHAPLINFIPAPTIYIVKIIEPLNN